MFIKERFIQELKENLSIVDIIGKYVSLSKKGTNYIGLSPFTKEKTPYFIVSDQKNIFKC
jgi:DNA primase